MTIYDIPPDDDFQFDPLENDFQYFLVPKKTNVVVYTQFINRTTGDIDIQQRYQLIKDKSNKQFPKHDVYQMNIKHLTFSRRKNYYINFGVFPEKYQKSIKVALNEFYL
jgi:hypothetical protein